MVRQYMIPRIDGHPPKKDGANSMWGKLDEVDNLIRLRQSVHDAFAGDPPLRENIHITIFVNLVRTNSGDLDNFVGGIFDGLMEARRKDIRPEWSDPEFVSIHPSKPIAIVSDDRVISINATKTFGSQEPWYSLVLLGD